MDNGELGSDLGKGKVMGQTQWNINIFGVLEKISCKSSRM
jgi:hypothetical protein